MHRGQLNHHNNNIRSQRRKEGSFIALRGMTKQKAMVRRLYRSLLKSSQELESEVMKRPVLTCAGEMKRFALPYYMNPSKLDTLRGVVRQQFKAHSKFTDSKDVGMLMDEAFAAFRQLEKRISMLQGRANEDQWRPRDERVKFCCGEQVRHRKYGYRGVVVGWDCTCTANEDWVGIMGVRNLKSGTEQPFYHVLVDVRDRTDAQTTYAAQENLEQLKFDENIKELADPIMHPEIEAYFTSFVPVEGRYILSENLRDSYPED